MNWVNCHCTIGLHPLPERIIALAFILGKGNTIFCDLSPCAGVSPSGREHCLAPDMELAAHPTLIPTKPSEPYSCAGPGLCSVLLHQLNKSAISGLRAVVAGAAQVNATHI